MNEQTTSASSSMYLQAHGKPDRDSGISTDGDSDFDSNYLAVKHYHAYPFSDDDDMPKDPEPQHANNTMINSKSYHSLQADNAIVAIKQLLKEDGWKKALRHKSGVTVHMLQQKGKGNDSKAPVFKGETIISGFSPQSIFYVIGMRKLWDESFEEGRLLENLNETTSITYESYRASSSSKAYDIALVEKIECSADGVILFACTSIESPKTPVQPGRSRRQIILQGWVLKPLHTNPPSTKVTFFTQESVKGWIPGFTKKSLARRPLVIAEVHQYLLRKADRIAASAPNAMASSTTQPRRPSILNNTTTPSFTSANKGLTGILTYPPPRSSSLPSPVSSTFNVSNTSSASLTSSTRRIKFAKDERMSSTIKTQELQATNQHASARLYPSSRHRTARRECVDTLKTLAASDLSEWNEIGERNKTKMYSKAQQGSALPILRGEGIFNNAWTPEQVCSVIQCFGARLLWDEYFEAGHIVERFSQKEYLVYNQFRSIFPIHSRDFSLLTAIESDSGTGTILAASTSVIDGLIPETASHIRAQTHVYGWVLEPLRSEHGKLEGVKVTFICHLDLGGATPLPPAIVRLLTNELPACVDRVQWYLLHHGCPPYIRRVAGKVTKEVFDSDSKTYHITYIAKHTRSRHHHSKSQRNLLFDPKTLWCTDIRTHVSMYASGFQVRSKPLDGIRVDLRADGSGIRIYTLNETLEGQTIEIDIEPHGNDFAGEGQLFIWNGKVLDKIQRESSQTAPPLQAQELTPHPMDTLSPPSLPSKAPWKPPSRSSSLPPPPSPTVTSQPKVQRKTRKQSISTEITEEALLRRRNSTVLVISEDLYFTGPQLSVVFLLMAVCYYMGKLSCRC